MNPERTTATAQPSLPLLEASGYTLWFKPGGRRTAWEPVHHATTEGECVNQVGIGGRRNGAWLVLPTGEQP